MLRWKAGVYCHLFRLEVALVLHHASVWSEVADVGVVVNELTRDDTISRSLHGWDLAVDLDTDGDRLTQLAQLYGYLARVLSREYDVALEGDHVHVEWDMKRGAPPIEPGYAHPTPPATPP